MKRLLSLIIVMNAYCSTPPTPPRRSNSSSDIIVAPINIQLPTTPNDIGSSHAKPRHHIIDVAVYSPNDVRIEEIKARTRQSRYMSKKTIAAYVAGAAIASAALTAAVTLTIHFTSCK